MVLYIIIGTLAAFGFLCLWNFLPLWFSRKHPGMILLCISRDPRQELQAICRYGRLWGLGFLKCPLWVVGSFLSPDVRQRLQVKYPDIVFFTEEEFSHYDPTGTGNSAGHHRGHRISEL